MNWEEKFFKGIFSESDGKPSFSRITSVVVLLCAITWVSSIVIHNLRHSVVPVLPDFGGLTAFVSIFYGVNKVQNALSNFINKGVPNGQ